MIDILLATYNGEKYIEAQIESLLSQTYKNWRLLIHDDGSTDKTIEIIKEFQNKDKRVVLIEDGVKCGGAGANFLYLLKFSTAEYVIFCDQDDIWLENKLEIMRGCFSGNEKPKAVFARGYLYTDEKGILGNIPSPILKKLEDAFFIAGGLQGCSLMFNKRVADKANEYQGDMVMHDFLITLVVLAFGELVYLEDKLMYYRQGHEGKVTANVERSMIKRLFKKHPVIDVRHHQSLVDFLNYFYEELTPHQRNKYEEFRKFCNVDSLLERLWLVVKNRFTLNQSVLYLMMKIILRPFKQ